MRKLRLEAICCSCATNGQANELLLGGGINYRHWGGEPKDEEGDRDVGVNIPPSV